MSPQAKYQVFAMVEDHFVEVSQFQVHSTIHALVRSRFLRKESRSSGFPCVWNCYIFKMPELNSALCLPLSNVGPRQKDFTPPTIQLCSHLFLLCHQKTIFWRLLPLTTHLSSSNFTWGTTNDQARKCCYKRRRRHKQIMRQSTVQSLMGAKLPGRPRARLVVGLE